MKEPRILTILFIGNELSRKTIAEISAIIHKNTNCDEKLNVSQYTEQDIRNLVTQAEAMKNKGFNSQKDPATTFRTPEDECCIFIGKMFEHILLPEAPITDFMLALIAAISEAKNDPLNEKSRKFMNALFILSQEDLVISKEIMRDMHINEEKLKVIKRIYNSIR